MLSQGTGLTEREQRRWLQSLLGLLLVLTVSACSSHPVVETVTTGGNQVGALPANAQPTVIDATLPPRDPDIEAAGDHIAEAITYLNSRRRDRREVALRALNQAETTLNHALHTGNHAEKVRTVLHTTLKDLDFAEHAVQRSAPDAVRQLSAINKNLDKLTDLSDPEQ